MLLARDADGVIAIGQASHAWISGQLARAWGNVAFPRPEPWEEVCLAAEQHDVGMARWDLHPTFNAETGLPHGFTEIALGTHLELWRSGPPRLLSQSRYAALLVSMHGARLYERRDPATLSAIAAAEVERFLRGHHEFQAELLVSLLADPRTAPVSDEATVRRNSDLLWTWDLLSLALCLEGWRPARARGVPSATGPVEIDLRADAGRFTVDPWPFAPASLTVRCEGRRITPSPGAEAMQDALRQAPMVTLEFTLGQAANGAAATAAPARSA